MILVRLKRRSFGDQLTYSIVVSSNQTSPSSNKFLEKVGYYKPLVDR
jgi:ribosomal protein S16